MQIPLHKLQKSKKFLKLRKILKFYTVSKMGNVNIYLTLLNLKVQNSCSYDTSISYNVPLFKLTFNYLSSEMLNIGTTGNNLVTIIFVIILPPTCFSSSHRRSGQNKTYIVRVIGAKNPRG